MDRKSGGDRERERVRERERERERKREREVYGGSKSCIVL